MTDETYQVTIKNATARLAAAIPATVKPVFVRPDTDTLADSRAPSAGIMAPLGPPPLPDEPAHDKEQGEQKDAEENQRLRIQQTELGHGEQHGEGKERPCLSAPGPRSGAAGHSPTGNALERNEHPGKIDDRDHHEERGLSGSRASAAGGMG